MDKIHVSLINEWYPLRKRKASVTQTVMKMARENSRRFDPLHLSPHKKKHRARRSGAKGMRRMGSTRLTMATKKEILDAEVAVAAAAEPEVLEPHGSRLLTIRVNLEDVVINVVAWGAASLVDVC